MAKPSKKLLARFQTIEELDFVLTCWCTDDGKKPEDYELLELINLAHKRQDEFHESGHTLWESLTGANGYEEKQWARKQVADIAKWIRSAEAELAKATR